MTSFFKFPRFLLISFFVLISFISLNSQTVFALADGDSCKSTTSSIKGGCEATSGRIAFCNITNSTTNEGKCVSCKEGDWACYRMYDNADIASSKFWQMQTLNDFQNNAMVVGEETGSLDSIGLAMLSNGINGLSTHALGVTPEVAEKLQAMGKPVPQGAAQYLASGIAAMTSNKPASTATYIADLGKQAGLYHPVYAQDGTGFSALAPILGIWKAFRNIAYLAFVVIFVVIGFMIMFRSKVSQQAVISIQLALPQIIMTLLLITFSYAIASFMIDLIYFLIYFLIAVFNTFGIIDTVSLAQEKLLTKNIFGIAFSSDYASTGASAVSTIVSDMLGKAGKILGFLSEGIAYLIFAIAILISLFKLFFQLLMSYVGLIVSTIFAPILLLFNAMPGSQSFSKWLKGIFANAVVFPVTAMMLLISAALLGDTTSWDINDSIGYKGTASTKIGLPILAGGLDTGAVMALVGIGFLMMMPKVVELTQKALGVEGGLGGMMAGIMEPLKQGFQGASYIPSKVGGAWGQTNYTREAEINRIRREGALRGSTPEQIGDAVGQVPGRWDTFTNLLRNRKP